MLWSEHEAKTRYRLSNAKLVKPCVLCEALLAYLIVFTGVGIFVNPHLLGEIFNVVWLSRRKSHILMAPSFAPLLKRVHVLGWNKTDVTELKGLERAGGGVNFFDLVIFLNGVRLLKSEFRCASVIFITLVMSKYNCKSSSFCVHLIVPELHLKSQILMTPSLAPEAKIFESRNETVFTELRWALRTWKLGSTT